ncbi:hypothetical protein [Paenibacillus beijingensis]|uniref:DUF4822 domain-containing protein n=1 Tax=Paenibacillus beijingensis TaxID=1126833 RepID=A0A0D5NPC0_9BACL|nr:hypothetical protein [Paenibacillus beijingensis]AJY77025.1 hypothetical protein VN24_23835 [Paenibacillus beijingensis]
MKKTAFSMVTIASVLFYFITTANAVGGDYTPVPKSADTQSAYINKLYEQGGKWYITVDPIEWYEGEAANKVFAEQEPDSGLDEAPDGYYIINGSEETATFEVNAGADVQMQIFDHDGNPEDAQINWNEQITLSKLAELLTTEDILSVSDYPYHVTIHDGKVTKIVQQYIP